MLTRRIVLAVLPVVLGCGSDGHPDTGYGAGQTPPVTANCVDLCQRIGDCAVALCNEDTKSTRYSGFGDLLTADCESTCTDAQVQTAITANQWQCVFQSSCRQVFDYDTCHAMSHYNCS